MGTRCEIYVTNKNEDSPVVELWKHWDGYPGNMVPLFEQFIEWVGKLVKGQIHFLTYPQTVASSLIAFDYERAKEQAKQYDSEHFVPKPDIRPRGNLQDAEYAYILELSNINSVTERNKLPQFRLIGYDCDGFKGLSDKDKETVRSANYKRLEEKHDKEVDMQIECPAVVAEALDL